MRFEEGENFGALLERRHAVSEDELMRVLLPVLEGLKLVHDAGFIHRDIKPDNIHIRADGSPVLLDFGSARLSHGHAHTVTILVAPGYAPFEQYYSSGEDQGPWTDLYSLGATCYRAIAGVAPMDAIARSKGILGSTRELLVPATVIGAGRYSERLLKAIDHALAFAEKDRPATIDEWRKELGGAGPAARPAPAVRAASAPTLVAGEPRAPVARTVGLIAAVAAIAVIGGGIGAYVAMRRPPPAPVEDVAARNAEKERLDKARIDEEQRAAARAEQQRREKALADAEAEQLRKAQALADEHKKTPARAAPTVEKKKRAQPPVALVPPPPEAKPAQECPQQGEIAIYTCYRELARRGDAGAALKVGELFEAGRGVAQSNNLAYLWYAIAEQRGAGGAGAKKDAVAARLQPVELQQAREQMKDYIRGAK
jgi:hypothetical protein